jgi:hypothetical protein
MKTHLTLSSNHPPPMGFPDADALAALRVWFSYCRQDERAPK